MTWEFNQTVAKIFATHVRQHIPDYELVLDKTLNICNERLSKESAILEIGCAIGETVTRLHHNGFKNIHAVDASQAMLDRCPKELATYYCSSEFPSTNIKYDAVICNWTLHFIKNKESYLKKIYDVLNPGGFLVLSEKTENEGLALERYHAWKQEQGVSEEEIVSKSRSLERVMHINSAEWYINQLRASGFHELDIFNITSRCFISFVAVK
jgi:tRNA (cmo5U34)-methyltransferase